MCYDGWDKVDAMVVCFQLGHPMNASRAAFFGEGTGPIWLSEVSCTGSETRLIDCGHHEFSQHNCDHAGVVCTSK